MRTFKLILLSLLLVAGICSAAAPWDGTKGDLTVTTIQFNPHMISAFGLGLVPGFTAPATQIWLKSSDPAVTAFRVTATYTDESGQHTAIVLAGTQPNGAMTVAPLWNIKQEQIDSLTVMRLRDGSETPLK